jgi:hypothetical protein
MVAWVFAGCVGEVVSTAPSTQKDSNPAGAPAAERPVDCTQVRDPGPALIRRLTREEYLKTVKASLGVDLADRAEMLPAELRAEGFSNTATASIVSFGHIDAYAKLAREVTARVSDWPKLVSTVANCTDVSDPCARAIIGGLGRKLYRRPMSIDEIDRVLPLVVAVRAENDSPVVLAQLVTERMLQSPQFLYRPEKQISPGRAVRELDGYELAARISYLVTQGPPDEPLMAAAGSGQLATTEGIREQVRRLAMTASAKEAGRSFVRDWLRLDAIGTMQRTSTAFTSRLAADMKDEALALFDHVMWASNGPLTQVIDAPFTFVSGELATFYGLTPKMGTQRYDLGAEATRGGVLMHAGVLALSGGSDRPSLVGRGLYVFENVLCQHVAAPSAQIMMMMSMGPLEPGKTQRFYSEARLARPECRGCHQQFDAFGYAFEGFNGVGQYQATDEHGNSLRADGTVSLHDLSWAASFQTPKEYVSALASSEPVARCLTQKPFQYAMGRPLEPADSCSIADIRRDAALNGNTYVSLLSAIATHVTFRTIRAE